MTKKHFLRLADGIRALSTTNNGKSVLKADVMHMLADFCESQNPQFDRERWLEYVYTPF